MALIEKKISNHPLLTDVERVVKIVGFLPQDSTIVKQVEFYYEIEHKLGDNLIKLPFSKKWVIDNSYLATVRDGQFAPIVNPDYEPELTDLDEGFIDGVTNYEFKMKPAYDYFKELTFDSPTPVNIPLLLNYYIIDNDSKGFYNDGY